MFSRTRSIDPRRRYDQVFFTDLVRHLREAGFKDVSVLLPHNLSGKGIGASEVTPEEFVRRGLNYPAVILKGHSEATRETIKIFFLGANANAHFVDSTYPSAHYGPPSVYVESPDPARTYALSQFFHERLSGGSLLWFFFLGVLSIIGILLLYINIAAVVGHSSGLLQQLFGWARWTDLVLSIAISVFLLYFYALPKGLLIAPSSAARILASVSRIAKGEVKDNPLVQLVVTVVGGVIVGFILKWLGVF